MLGRTPDDAAEPVAVAQRQWCLLQEEVQLKRDLTQPLTQLQETSRSIAETQRECKLDVDTDQYVESFKPFLMDVINAWSKVRSYSASVHLEPLGARLDGKCLWQSSCREKQSWSMSRNASGTVRPLRAVL